MEFPNDGEPVVYVFETIAEIADVFEVSIPTIRKWKEAGCPGSHGNWNAPEIQQWLTARERSKDHRGRLPRSE